MDGVGRGTYLTDRGDLVGAILQVPVHLARQAAPTPLEPTRRGHVSVHEQALQELLSEERCGARNPRTGAGLVSVSGGWAPATDWRRSVTPIAGTQRRSRVGMPVLLAGKAMRGGFRADSSRPASVVTLRERT